MIKWNNFLNSYFNAFVIVVALISLISCNGIGNKKSGKIVAEVDNSQLFEDDILKMGLALDSGFSNPKLYCQMGKK